MISDYDSYDALGLAELVRGGQVTPLELVNEAIRRIEATNPAINAVIYKMYEQACRDGAGDTAGRALLWRALSGQGSGRHGGGGAAEQRDTPAQGVGAAGGRRVGAPLEGGGIDHPGQDQHAGTGDYALYRARRIRPHAQPVRHRAHLRRIKRRFGGGRGRTHGAHRLGRRRRRLDPDPGGLLRAFRL